MVEEVALAQQQISPHGADVAEQLVLVDQDFQQSENYPSKDRRIKILKTDGICKRRVRHIHLGSHAVGLADGFFQPCARNGIEACSEKAKRTNGNVVVVVAYSAAVQFLTSFSFSRPPPHLAAAARPSVDAPGPRHP